MLISDFVCQLLARMWMVACET